jgi:hypothetical protein
MSAKKKGAVEAAPATITAFKGFDKNLKCRGYQYEVGKTYEHEGAVQACASGFHACENPLDVFDYYAPGESRYCVVEQGGELARHEGDSKIASATITITAELTIPQFVERAIKWAVGQCVPANAKHSDGYQSASSATGDQSASSATGYQSASSATGYRSASSATGDQSASSATGYQSASSATGDQSASSATGDRSASSATGKNAVAMNIGVGGRAKADKDGAIVLCNHDDNYNIRHIRASKVGENGIKADTWYVLNDKGEFVEVAS